MRCLIFAGETALKTVDAFNSWARDKALFKDVIVHSHIVQPGIDLDGALVILVFFDENLHPSWVGVTE